MGTPKFAFDHGVIVEPPKPEVVVEVQWRYLAEGSHGAALALVIITWLAVLSVIGLNQFWSNKTIVKMSQYRIDAVACIGVALFITGLIYYAMDEKDFDEEALDFACKMRTYTFSVGFGLFIGAIASKLYRVRKIFLNKTLSRVSAIKDMDLFKIIFAIFAVEVLGLILWTVLDEPHRVIYTGPETATNDPYLFTRERYGYCEAGTTFSIIMMLFNAGLLLIVSSWALETRNIHVQACNNAQELSYVILLVTIVGAFEIALTFLIKDENVLFGMRAAGAVLVGWAAIVGGQSKKFYAIFTGNEEEATNLSVNRSTKKSSVGKTTGITSIDTEREVESLKKRNAALENLNTTLEARVKELEAITQEA